MKRFIQLSVLITSCICLALFLVTINSDVATELDKKNAIVSVETAKEQADRLIKQAAMSLVTPHLQESLQQSLDADIFETDDFLGFPATCFAPDTDPKAVETFYKNRAALANSLGLSDSRFNLGGRWGTTATNGSGLGQGDVTTLTWSYVPDGTTIGNNGCGVPDQGTFSSDFIAFFNSIYGGPTTPGDYTTAPWHDVFVAMFDSWSNVSGLVFVYEPNDDGATVVTGGAGVVGTRGDFRISGHRLDGNSNVLACNYFPNNGDMIIDTSDNFYVNNPGIGTTNVLTHEIGHGLGIQHVCPVVETKLMEPFVTTAFNGPQEDDILATNRHYGDSYSGNDTPALASSLGNTGNPVTYNETQRSIDDNGDVDYFSFTISESTLLSATLTPTGTTYLSGVQNSNGSCSAGSTFNALAVSDLQFEVLNTNGSTVLATANVNGVGANETLNNITLPSAGTYYVRVSQQGAAVNNVQMYDLSISLQAAVLTPQISFSTIVGNATEDTNCNFTDYDVDVNIAAAPSANADVNFTANGSSTATEGVDFDLITNSVTFAAGSTVTQTMTFRVYNDAFVEGDETIIIDFTVNANGGDATANNALDTYTFTLLNDDNAPPASGLTTVFTEDFESYSDFDITPVGGWTMLDGDGDATYGSNTYDWTNSGYTGTFIVFNSSQTTPSAAGTTFDAHSGNKGYYCFNSTGNVSGTPLNDDYIFTPQIDLAGTGSELKFWAKSITDQYGLERFRVGISTTDTAPASFTWLDDPAPYVEAPITWTEYTYDLSAYSGNVYIAIHVVSADAFAFQLDDFEVTTNVSTTVQTAVNSGTTNASFNFNNTGNAFAYDTGSNFVMANFVNNQADDYGCTELSVSRAGTGAQPYNGSAGVNQVMDKRFTSATANTINSGDVDATFYFDASEISGWETATTNNRNNLYIAREVAGAVVELANATIGSLGSNVTLGATFSSAEGDFYFGLQSAFQGCAGSTKTWDGSSWNPAGAPGNTDTVVINGTYDTATDGNIEACEITINSTETLTVDPLGYIRSQGDINVNGNLIVAHTGNVVQVNSDAVVNKGAGANINIHITSPVLQTRDFMVIGSPMDAETRNGVYNSAFSVMQHTPDNFNPHDHPNIPQGATNFKDKEGDFWAQYTGNINVGEGFIVRPQSGFTDPANTTYDLTYSQGTLNSGDITRSITYNAANSPLGTPNIISNPYASGISAFDFITDNSLDALYFWEHLTPPTVIVPGESIMFDMGDVSIRNAGGGTAANNGGAVPGNIISTAQGFAVKATTSGSVSFTNSMRVTTGNTTLRTTEENVDRLWLRVESDTYESGNNLMIGFNPNATSGWDQGYDTERLASMVSLYSQLETGNARMAIQTREEFTSGIKIPVGFSTLIKDNTSYTISLTDFEGENLSEIAIYLYDNELNVLTNLKERDYSFQSGVETYDRRFTVLFESENLGVNAQVDTSVVAYPNPTNDVLNIVAPNTSIENIIVFDVLGRTVKEYKVSNERSYQLDMSTMDSAIYFVEIRTAAGKITKQIVKE